MLFGEEDKMKKYYSKISGCILLVALEILMFLWTPYYKGFICTTYIVEHINAGDIIFRLVYYAIYFLSVYTMFSYYCFGKFYSFFMRSPVGLILSFASVRLMADVANYIIYYFFNDYVFTFAACIIEVVFLFFTLWLISDFISDGKFRFCPIKGTIPFFIATFVIVALLAIYCTFQYNGFAYIVEKYTVVANVRVAYTENIGFILEVSRLIFICALNIICFLYFYFSVEKCGLIKSKSNVGFAKIITRLWAVLFLTGILYVVKYIAYPIDLYEIIPSSIISSSDTTYSNTNETVKDFRTDTCVTPLSRFSSYEHDEKRVLNLGSVTVKNGKDRIKTFTYFMPFDEDSNYYCELVPVETEYTESTDYLECNVQRLENFGLFFFDGDQRYAIKTENIKSQSENKVLTAMLETLISDGEWNYFEYGCDYLKKYDSDFINPYIERYANGDFTENENKVNQEINTDYMINFAQKMLEIK